MIFRAMNRVKRDSLSAELAAEFGITSKAVRDIWNLRTWTWTTLPYWTQADHDDFLPASLRELQGGAQGRQCPRAVRRLRPLCKSTPSGPPRP